MATFSYGDMFGTKANPTGAPATDPTKTFGKSKTGKFAAGLVPSFLTGAAQQAGGGLGDFFAQAFAGLQDPRALNAQLSNIAQGTAGRARKARTMGKFKGSPLGEVMAGGLETGGAAVAQQARLADQQRKLQQGLGLAQGFTGAVTSPLMQILGIGSGGMQSAQALAEQRRQFEASQPSDLEKGLGFASSLMGSVGSMIPGLCWVARATLQDDRWRACRQYLLNEATPYLRNLYRNNGEVLADRVLQNPTLRAELTPVFVEMAKRGAKYLGTAQEK